LKILSLSLTGHDNRSGDCPGPFLVKLETGRRTRQSMIALGGTPAERESCDQIQSQGTFTLRGQGENALTAKVS
jgi:hypothetical protein